MDNNLYYVIGSFIEDPKSLINFLLSTKKIYKTCLPLIENFVMRVVGLRVEKYLGEKVRGYNCEFEYYESLMEKHIICGRYKGKAYEIEFEEIFGECPSGWCTAIWAIMRTNKVNKFEGFHYIPERPLHIEYPFKFVGGKNRDIAIENKIFQYNKDGGDEWYPHGYYKINMELFKATPRLKAKRPVWIFMGDSGKGKSFLASKLTELSVYETDCSAELPEIIKNDVIVLGNKYIFTLEDIEKRIFEDHETQIVKFK